MDLPLLKTKLHTPSVRPGLVSRSRLVARIDQAVDARRRLTLLSAPAGFGKTTLLAEWAHRARAARDPPLRVAWLSLDEGDNDPARFWSYVIAALQTVQPGIARPALALLRAAQPQRPPIEALLTGLINEIADLSDPLVLVLDDLHTLTDTQVNEGLAFLLDHLPSQAHLIASTRADPPWALARMRARQEITELRTADLRFTPDEVTAFLNDVMGLALSEEDVAALDARTEGWIAGLQLAALSMQGREDVGAFLRAFGGSHRFILDYLVEEVLERQSGDVREFLLKTSLLDRMTASLCDAVMGEGPETPAAERGHSSVVHPPSSSSQRILEHLEQANLFLTPLDDERHWYRYHRLFADLLQSRLQEELAGQVPALHRRASEWYLEHSLISGALSHALQAGDVERAARLVEENALSMMEHGELHALEKWLNALPEGALGAQPWLCVARAWVCVFTGQLDAAELLLQRAEAAMATSETPSGEQRLTGHIASIRAGITFIQGDVARAVLLAREALERVPEQDAMVRGWTTAALGTALGWSGDLIGAEQAFRAAVAISQARQDGYVSVMALCNVAVTQLDRGRLHKAARTFHQAIRLAHEYAGRSGHQLPVVGYAHTYLADVLRQWDDLQSAMGHVQEGIGLCRQWGEPQLLASGHVRLARILQAVGDREGAIRAIETAKQAASGTSSWYVERVAADEARLSLARGDVAATSRWAAPWKERATTGDPLDYRYEMTYRALSRVLIAEGDHERALGLLALLQELFERASAGDFSIEVLVLQALAFHSQGREDQALAMLEHALALSEPEDYVRIYLDEGAPMRALLTGAARAGIATGYVTRLLARFEREDGFRRDEPQPPPSSHGPPLPWVEPLSEREIEVLRLLRTDLTSTEIGRELYISKNTARSHIAHIYDKLGVHSRADAIRRAEELGLL